MNKKALRDIIEEGENINVEFKLKFSSQEKIAKEMMAFANTGGGVIIFGVDDDKNIVGVESEKTESELIRQAANSMCEPPLEYTEEFINLDDCELVVITIPESTQKPHRFQDYEKTFDINKAIVYVRVNDKSVQASKEMIRVMRAASSGASLKKYTIGEVEKSVFNYLEKNEFITVSQLTQLANISYRRASRTLVKLIRAGLLIIHTHPNAEDRFSAV